jgi:hypothetical protein
MYWLRRTTQTSSFVKVFDLPSSLPSKIFKITFSSRMGQWTQKPNGEYGNLILPSDLTEPKQIQSFLEPLSVEQKFEVKKNQLGLLVARLECLGDFGLNQTIDIEFNWVEMSISGPQHRSSSWFPTPLEWKKLIQFE